jgi:hypothetical protein
MSTPGYRPSSEGVMGTYGVEVTWLVAAGSCAAWIVLRVVVVVVAVAVRPRAPLDTGGEAGDTACRRISDELSCDDPPAVVNVLVNNWTVTEDAAGATLLDLAARGYLDLDQPHDDPTTTTVRLVASTPQDAAAASARTAGVIKVGGRDRPLTDHERQVLGRVRDVAASGEVPLASLTLKNQREARRWSAGFAASVVAEARRRGLVRRRVPVWVVVLGCLAAAVPAGAVARAVRETAKWQDAHAIGAGVASWALLALIMSVGNRGLAGTAEGRARASSWRELRACLDSDKVFTDLPPLVVTLWDRYLAYGAALGVSRAASSAIGLGRTDRTAVWSSYSGRWTRVRVRYPHLGVRYGATVPGLLARWALLCLAGTGLIGLAWAFPETFSGGSRSPGQLWRVPDSVGEVLDSWGDAVVSAAGTVLRQWDAPLWAVVKGARHRRAASVVPAVVGGLLIARGFYLAMGAVIGPARSRAVSGAVLRVTPRRSRWVPGRRARLHHLAIDDGGGDVTTSWALPPDITRGFGPGAVVEATVRPWTRRVTSLDVIHSGNLRPLNAVMPDTMAAASPATSSPIRADELAGCLGVALRPGRSKLLPGVWAFPLVAGSGEVVLAVGNGLLHRTALGLTARGEPVPGVGEEAYLMPGAAAARSGDVVVRIAVPIGPPIPPQGMVTALMTVLGRSAESWRRAPRSGGLTRSG